MLWFCFLLLHLKEHFAILKGKWLYRKVFKHFKGFYIIIIVVILFFVFKCKDEISFAVENLH